NETFLLLLAFMLGISVPSLALSADVAVRRRTEDELRRTHEELDQRVQQRTAAVAAANEQLEHEIARRREAESVLTRDLDHRHRIEAELRESEARYRAIVDHSPESIIVVRVTQDGGLVYEAGNPVVETISGIPEAQMRGRDLRDFLPPELVRQNDETYQRC